MTRRISRFLARHRRARWVQTLDDLILDLHKGIENLDYKAERNGEKWVLNALAEVREISTVFDVGANKGEWTNMAREIFSAATIHSFEIVPETFKQLEKSVTRDPKVVANNIGLSDTTGHIDIYFDPSRGRKATSVEMIDQSHVSPYTERLTLPVTTGELYCEETGISHIDFLKVDAEGHEPKVLRGFENMLENGSIDIIQFEYGFINIDTGFLLKDFYQFLARFDMKIGKIYPNHVEFRAYKRVDENFYGPNFIATNSRNRDIIEALENR